MKTRSRHARRSLLGDERGLSATEYVIIMLLICVVCFLAWRIFGSSGRDRTAGAHHVVDGLATSSSADDEGGAAGGHGGSAPAPEAASTAPGATPHGGRGDIQQGRRLSVPGQEAEFGEDPEIRASRMRTRNFRWVVIGVMTAGVLVFLLGRSKRG